MPNCMIYRSDRAGAAFISLRQRPRVSLKELTLLFGFLTTYFPNWTKDPVIAKRGAGDTMYCVKN